jgi:hypothetical protein
MKVFFAIIALSVFSGCTTPPPLYNYEDYSKSYYKSIKNANDETALKLQSSMEKTIEATDKSRSGRVPPGIYANLGYLHLKSGETQKAIELFNMEKSVYPEAAHFMDRIIQKAQLIEGDKQ